MTSVNRQGGEAMGIEVIRQDNLNIIRIAGRVDSEQVRQLEETLTRLLDSGATRLALDFSRLEYINSSGLRVLLMAQERLAPGNGRIAIWGARDYIRELFEIAGLDSSLGLYSSREQALESL